MITFNSDKNLAGEILLSSSFFSQDHEEWGTQITSTKSSTKHAAELRTKSSSSELSPQDISIIPCHLQTMCTVLENVHGFYHRDALSQITESENRMYLFSLRKKVHPNLVLETCTSSHGKAECQEKFYLFLGIIKKMSLFLQQLSHTGNSIKHLQEITSFNPHNVIIIPLSPLWKLWQWKFNLPKTTLLA